jgi:hypothetical protein
MVTKVGGTVYGFFRSPAAGSARLATPFSHVSEPTSLLIVPDCYMWLVSGLDHIYTLPFVVVVDIEAYIKYQRKGKDDMGNGLQSRHPASRAQPTR